MSPFLLGVVTVIYTGVAFSEFLKGNVPMAVIFASYAVANIGFIYAIHSG